MIKVQFDASQLIKDLNGIVNYSEGYLDGVKVGKRELVENIAKNAIENIGNYIDAAARVDPQALQHVYEWYQYGNPNSRLFDIDYKIVRGGLSFNYTFSQSRSMQSGSSVPFYDKARVMEEGIPVTITPKKSGVLAFEDNGEKVFTKKSVFIESPGGENARGSFENNLKQMIELYFTQAFSNSSGLSKHLEKQTGYKDNFKNAPTGGKALGKQVGYNWIVKAGDN